MMKMKTWICDGVKIEYHRLNFSQNLLKRQGYLHRPSYLTIIYSNSGFDTGRATWTEIGSTANQRHSWPEDYKGQGEKAPEGRLVECGDAEGLALVGVAAALGRAHQHPSIALHRLLYRRDSCMLLHLGLGTVCSSICAILTCRKIYICKVRLIF